MLKASPHIALIFLLFSQANAQTVPIRDSAKHADRTAHSAKHADHSNHADSAKTDHDTKHDDSTKEEDSTKRQLDSLMRSAIPADRKVLNARLRALAASNTERDMSIAASYYYKLKDTRTFDSLMAAEIVKFPRGLEARVKAQQAITRMETLSEMERSYGEFIKNFPPDSYPELPFDEDRLPYDRIRIALANGYAKEKDTAKAGYYASLLEADFWKVNAYSSLSGTFHTNGDLSNAVIYQKKAVEAAAPFAEDKLSNNAIENNAASSSTTGSSTASNSTTGSSTASNSTTGNSATGNSAPTGSPAASYASAAYPGACRVYAQLLYEQKNYSEAMRYIGIAMKAAKAPGPAFDFTYAEILAALGRNQEAYERIESAVKSGKATEEMSHLFKKLYVQVKGSNAGLDAYEKDIRKGALEDLTKKLKKSILNLPAADFTLTDLQGNKVTLSSLKGKVVIVDFWATWCVPCKASFPAMQMAVNKYKDDPGVKFVFIHTWERTATPVEDAKAYIAGTKYSFQVLMDTKDLETKANKVVDSYNVTSIPTKFIIDPRGIIRFRLTGFEGSNTAAVDEISVAIELARGKS